MVKRLVKSVSNSSLYNAFIPRPRAISLDLNKSGSQMSISDKNIVMPDGYVKREPSIHTCDGLSHPNRRSYGQMDFQGSILRLDPVGFASPDWSPLLYYE